jgi:hypothetical protein
MSRGYKKLISHYIFKFGVSIKIITLPDRVVVSFELFGKARWPTHTPGSEPRGSKL